MAHVAAVARVAPTAKHTSPLPLPWPRSADAFLLARVLLTRCACLFYPCFVFVSWLTACCGGWEPSHSGALVCVCVVTWLACGADPVMLRSNAIAGTTHTCVTCCHACVVPSVHGCEGHTRCTFDVNYSRISQNTVVTGRRLGGLGRTVDLALVLEGLAMVASNCFAKGNSSERKADASECYRFCRSCAAQSTTTPVVCTVAFLGLRRA